MVGVVDVEKVIRYQKLLFIESCWKEALTFGLFPKEKHTEQYNEFVGQGKK